MALFKRGGDLIEEDMHHVFVLTPSGSSKGAFLLGSSLEVRAAVLSQAGGGQAAVVQGAAFAQGDHLVSH